MPFSSALGEFALGGIADTDSLSVADPLSGILSDPSAQREYLLRATPIDAIGGLSFSGANYATTAVGPSAGGPMAMEMWVYPRAIPVGADAVQMEFVGTASASTRRLGIQAATLNPYFQVKNDAGTVFSVVATTVSPAGYLPLNTWTHVAGILDTALATIYILKNGVIQATLPVTGTFAFAPSFAGSVGGSVLATSFFNGRVAAPRVWSVTKTDVQIQALMNYHVNGKEAGLAMAWLLNDISANAARELVDTADVNTALVLTGSTPRATFDVNVQPRAPIKVLVDLSGGGYVSTSADTPYKHFPPALANPANFTVTLPVPALSGAAQAGFGAVGVNDADGLRSMDGRQDWLGSDISVMLGRPTDPLSLFTTVVKGVGSGISRPNRDSFSALFKDARFKLQRPLQVNKYGGFGAAMKLDGATSFGTATYTQPAGSMTMFCRAFFNRATGTTEWVMATGTSAETGQRALIRGSAGRMQFQLKNDAGTLFTVGSNVLAAVVTGVWYDFTVVLDATALMAYLYVNGALVHMLPVTGTFNTTPASATLWLGERSDATLRLQGVVDELRFFSVALTAAQVAAYRAQILTTSEPGLQYYNKLDQGTGTSSAPEIGTGTIAWTAPAWVGTAEGGSELVGKPKPLAFGVRRQVAPIWVDTQNGVYQFHDGSMQAVTAMRDKGQVRWSFNADLADIYSAVPASGQFNTCLARGLVRIGDAPTGIITGDIQGDNGGTQGYQSTVTGIARKILLQLCGWADADIDLAAFAALLTATGAVVNGFYWDKEITRDAAINEVFSSMWAWWVPNRVSAITCGRISDPALATATVAFPDAGFVEPTKGGRYGDDSLSVRVGEVQVLYRPYQQVLSDDQVAGVVTTAARNDFGEQYRVARATDPNAALDTDVLKLTTGIDDPFAAQALAQYVLGVLQVDRRVYRRTLSYGVLSYFIGTVAAMGQPSGSLFSTFNAIVIKLAEAFGDSNSDDKVEVDFFV